ncbi:MAG TPA: bifunctional metallophosphatase/5'-nucleotidase [Candidatus Binatia bacterium]|nr:bifunctional metallophosphatase/5'-nucleotidase [Candidatus Binatia bacterium]
MPTSQTIYVDMDDVLCETARGCLEIIERVFGKRVDYEQLTDFNLGNACELSPEETAELYHIVHHPDELLKLQPVKGAIAVLNQWIAAGFEIAIVTGRPPPTYEPSLDWLAREQVPYHSFTLVDKYGRFTSAETIAVSLSEFAARGFVFAVEDSPTMARYLVEQMKVPVKLFDRPWNRTTIEHPQITRHNHWFEIAEVCSG